MENLEIFTEHIDKVYCKRCHRQLKDEESKKIGYGIVCYKKLYQEKLNNLFEVDYGTV